MQQIGILSPEDLRSLQAMITESINTSLASSIKAIIETTIAETLKAIPTPTATTPSSTTTSTTSNTNQRQHQPYQRRTPSHTMSDKQQQWLMHSYERINMKTYEINKYITYTHFLSFRTPKETPSMTHRYLTRINHSEPTDEQVKNPANQLLATLDHINKGKQMIKDQQEAIITMLSSFDTNHEDIREITEQAINKGNKNTTYVKEAAYKDIYIYTSNAAIQYLHDSLRTIATDQDQTTITKYIELSKQLKTTTTKITELQTHQDNTTVPLYLQHHFHQWTGPIYTDHMATMWKEANLLAQTTLMNHTIDMLKCQAQELRRQISETKIEENDDNLRRAQTILLISERRQIWTKQSEDNKSLTLPASFFKLINVSHTRNLTGGDFLDIFSCNTNINPNNRNIVTVDNYKTIGIHYQTEYPPAPLAPPAPPAPLQQTIPLGTTTPSDSMDTLPPLPETPNKRKRILTSEVDLTSPPATTSKTQTADQSLRTLQIPNTSTNLVTTPSRLGADLNATNKPPSGPSLSQRNKTRPAL